MQDTAFLGSGMRFPPGIDRGTGRFVLSSGADSVKESIYIILMTNRGERWLEPGFGSRLMSYTFMDTSLTMLGMMASDIRAALLEQEPRIADVVVDIDPDKQAGCLYITIGYTVAQENTRDNLVFPFYLNAAAEEREQDAEE